MKMTVYSLGETEGGGGGNNEHCPSKCCVMPLHEICSLKILAYTFVKIYGYILRLMLVIGYDKYLAIPWFVNFTSRLYQYFIMLCKFFIFFYNYI